MAYCTVEDVVHELHPTLEHEMRMQYDEEHQNDPWRPDFEENIAMHIEKAEACAEASLARAYAVPLKKATGIVTSAVCKIAAYFASAAFAEKEQILIDKYETAMQILDWLVEAEEASLVDEEAEEDDLGIYSGVGWGSDPQIFTRAELAKW